MHTKASGVVVFIACVGFSAASSAQTAPDTTGSPAKRPAAVQPTFKPRVATPAPAPAAPAGERKVIVKRFDLSGNTLFPTAQLQALVWSYTNREITLKEIYEAADKISDFYHAAGYSLAYAAPPAQKLTEGTVKIEIIEGRVGGIEVAGNQSYSADRLQRYLGDFKPGQVYRLEDLDGGLRRINTLPGISAKATLRPGHDYGTSDLLINADEDRINATLVGDNYGRDNIGQYRSTLSGAFNNPLGYGDQLQLLYLHSEEGKLDYGYLGYTAPISYSGARAQVSYAQAKFTTQASSGTGSVTVEGKNNSSRVAVDFPLMTEREAATSASVAVTNQQSNADIAGVRLTNEINLTLLELGVTQSHTFDNFAVYQTALTVATNGKSTDRIHCDGTETVSNPEDCNRQLFRMETDVQYLQPLIGRLDALVHANGVYSPDPLPPVNPFSLGGPNNVRGYATSEERGDTGAFGSLTLRVGFPLGPAQAQLRGFGESGFVYRVDAAAAGLNERDSLGSVGVGADLFWRFSSFKLTGKVDYSVPTDSHVSSDGKDGRVYASLAAGF